ANDFLVHGADHALPALHNACRNHSAGGAHNNGRKISVCLFFFEPCSVITCVVDAGVIGDKNGRFGHCFLIIWLSYCLCQMRELRITLPDGSLSTPSPSGGYR